MPEKSLTFVLSAWGAILSTFLAGIKFMEFRHGQVQLHVRVKRDMKILPKTTEYGDKTYIVITAGNRGQRPVILGTAGLMYRRTRSQEAGGCVSVDSARQPQPIRLDEGESRDFMIDQASVEKDGIGPGDYVGFVNDRTGRTFYSHGWLGRLFRCGRLQ